MFLNVLVPVFCVLVIGCRYGRAQDSTCVSSQSENGPILEVKHAAPCETYPGTVKRINNDLWVLIENFTACDNKEPRDAVYRVETSTSNATLENPLVFVARDSNNVQTWRLPLIRQGKVYTSFRQIVCQSMLNSNPADILFIDSFTSSLSDIGYEIHIEPIDSFVLELNERVEFYIQPNAPQVFYFKFPADRSGIQVIASSNMTGCAIVSVQNASCPFSDTDPALRTNAIYQTMTTSAFIAVDERQATSYSGLYVVVAVTDASNCFRTETASLSSRYIQLVVERQQPASKYSFAIVAPLLFFVPFGIVMALLVGFPCFHVTIYPFVCGRQYCTIKSRRAMQQFLYNDVEPIVSEEHQDIAIQELIINEDQPIANDKPKQPKQRLLDEKEESIKLPHLLKTDISVLEKQYSVYAWNTITVGIFYGLPAFQLVLTGELIYRASGNQDTCYFNFKCLRPLGILDAFNSVWSNVGFLILGIAFIGIVGIKHYKARKLKLLQPNIYSNYGVPHFFGIYYALGVALILEGFMSACYHICPSFDDFQFDSAFMYIISGLLIVKIFQSRHPDIHANAFAAFLCFAVVIFLTLIGIHEDTIMYWSVRVILVCLVLVTISSIWLSFYFYHDWSMSSWIEFDTYKGIWRWFRSWCSADWNCRSLKPRHLGRFTKLIIAVVGNVVIGLIVISVSREEVAVVVLVLFIANFLLYAFLYLVSKLWFKEPWTLMSLVFLVVQSVAWCIGFYLLLDVTARREATPAKSREYNRDCVALDFYGTHDVWHFVSAMGLFFTFLFVLTMDDGLATQRRDTINVF